MLSFQHRSILAPYSTLNPYSFYYKALNGQAPSYISDLFTKYEPSRNLRSGTKFLLTVPRSNTKSYGSRSFQVAAAELFNKLPMGLLKNCCFHKFF